MDSRKVQEHAGWLASYSEDQTKALIECMTLKIEQQSHVIQSISRELELCDEPKEERPEVIIESIRSMIAVDDLEVSSKCGWFEWTA